MDPHENYRDTRSHLNYNSSRSNNKAGALNETGHNPPDNPDGSAPDSRNPGTTPTGTQPRYSDGYTMISPNESRRTKLRTMAQKEEEDFQRWKEANRPGSVNLPPEKLGGSVSMAEARERQARNSCHSKLQKKLKKEELDRRRRQEKEEDFQKMKAQQREKTERLEERRRREEQQRREQFRQDHLRRTDTFLQRFEQTGPAAVASSSATHTSSWIEALEDRKPVKVKEEDRIRDVQQDHRRVNAAFLDKLEGQSASVKREEEERGGGVEAQRHPAFGFEDFKHQLPQSAGPQDPLAHLKPDPDQSFSGWAEEADPEADFEWAAMKLESKFPYCSRAFLQDILAQCNGDYQQAYTLLSDSLH